MLEKLVQAATITLLLHLVMSLSSPASLTASDVEPLQVPQVAVGVGASQF